ncbi:MAG TPA: carboxypeptidase-like regulatory domain-containing protein [Cyclobacteriaceae bacterium]|jgi:hypothetical protein|nr:carboxypeptidase-like regulatory domain-containing protein [Cyclobacteriaceae bacterium]
MQYAGRLGAFIFLLITNLCFAQGNQSLRGKIVDSKTNEPIIFASVKLVKGQSILGGVVSNSDGGFQFPARFLEEADSVIITCIGYSKQALLTRSFNASDIVEIKLKAGSVVLNELVVSEKRVKLSARNIVRFAIDNLQQNCPAQPFSYIGYYRDYQKDKDQFVNLNEALVQVYDKGFGTNDFDSTKIQLYQYRQNSDFRRDSLMAIPYDNSKTGDKFIPGVAIYSFGGNEFSLMRIHDAIRNHNTFSYSFVNKFDNDFVKNHAFKLLDMISLDNVQLYHLSIRSLFPVSGKNYSAKGEIFIERGNYAIHKLVYSAFMNEGGKEKLLYNTNVEYTRTNGKLHLNYISFNNFFISNTGEGFKVNYVRYDNQTNSFVVTFNHAPQKPAAVDKSNYEFLFHGKPLKIEKVYMQPGDDRVYVVSLLKTDPLQSDGYSEIKANISHLRDQNGRELDRIVYKTVNQFREFFLQRVVVEKGQKTKASFMSKEMTLLQNKIEMGNKEASTAWMNTPLIKDLASHK